VSGAIWKQLAEHVDNFLDSITVADLSNKAKPEIVYGLRVKSKRILADRGMAAESHEPEKVEVA
jgi:DNA-binding IscR family transcriptional regulator